MTDFVNLSPANAHDWDEVVRHSTDGWAFHLAGWLQPTAAVWGRRCHSFAAVEQGRWLGVMPLGFNPETRLLTSGAWTDGGPIVRADLPANQRRRLWKVMLEHSLAIARDLQATQLQVSITPLCQASLNARWAVNPLLDYGFADVSSHAWVIDLSPSDAQLRANLSENITRQLKKARAAGYVVERQPGREVFELFYEIHRETYERSGLPAQPRGNFLPLVEALEPAGHFLMWTCLDSDRRPIGFHGATLFGPIAYYHVGCCLTDHLDNGVNPLLFWTAMMELKALGYLWYGLGEAYPLATGKTKTLSDFKRKFGAEMHRWFRGEFTLATAEVVSPVPPPVVPSSWLRTARDTILSFFRSRTSKRAA